MQYVTAARAADHAVNAAQAAAAAAGTIYLPIYVTDTYAAAASEPASSALSLPCEPPTGAGDATEHDEAGSRDVPEVPPAVAAVAAAAVAAAVALDSFTEPPRADDHHRDDVSVSAWLPSPPSEKPQPPPPPPPPPLVCTPPPAAAAAGDDSFDDLAKRFEALKRRH